MSNGVTLTLDDDSLTGLTISGGTVALDNAASTVSGATTIENATLQTGTLDVSNGVTLTLDDDSLTGITISGGTVALDSATSTVSGATTIENGTLQDGTLTVTSGANLELVGTIDNTGTIEVDPSGPPPPTTTALEIHGPVTLTGGGTVTLDGSSDQIIAATGGGTLDNYDTISGVGTIGDNDGTLTLNNELGGTIEASGGTLTIETGATFTNSGTIETASGATLVIDDAVAGTGSGTIGNHGIMDFESSVASGQTITFTDGTGTLRLADPAAFSGSITGYGSGDTIDLSKFGYSASETDVWTQNGATGTLVIDNGSGTQSIVLTGTYTQNDFALASDGGSGTPGTDIVWSPAQGSVTGVDNAGNAIEGSAVTANLTDTNASAVSYTWLDNGSVVGTDSATFTPTDDAGHTLDVVIGFTDHGTTEQITTLAGTVDPAAPVLGGATSATVYEGGLVTFGATDTAAFTDDTLGTVTIANLPHDLTNFSAGDYTASTGTWTGTAAQFNALTFDAGEEGTYSNIAITASTVGAVSDTAGGYALTVNDAPLTSGTVSVSGGVEGTTAATLSATFSDAYAAAPTSDFSGTINWGDGTAATPFTSADVSGSGGSFTVSGLSHLYAEDGTYNVSVAINDEGGSTTTDSGTATVADAPLTAGAADGERRR